MSHSTSPENPFVVLEKETLSFWQKHAIYHKVQARNKDNPPFLYLDGPPFATGLPHHGHLLASTIKDVIPRFYEMQGYAVPRQFGWDCHGVPIEHEIDKSLGLSTQEAVQKLGVKGYNQACRDIVERYTDTWKTTLNRIGRWLNFDTPYKTMDTNFMESVWWAVAKLYAKGLLYQGEKVVPYSTALQTGLSNFEASSNYQTTQSPSIQVLFKLKDSDDYLVIWTTTPWTLPSNLAVCIGPYHYVKVKSTAHDKCLIVAEACIGHLPNPETYTICETLAHEDLVGARYEPLFHTIHHPKVHHYRVLLDPFVSISDGTGLVHMAPAHGEDDYRVCQNANIAPLCLLNKAGCFIEEVDSLQGLPFLRANKPIIALLKSKDRLLSQSTIDHNYPFCPRSDTPLMYRTVPSWYVNVTAIKQQLLAANDRINWVPEHIKNGRFGKWLEGAKDWAISRSRYWGTPIPIWKNELSGACICVGSIAELGRLSGVNVTDLHTDHVDAITFTLENEPGLYKRIPDVLDCWFESGCVPFAQWHYPFENKEHFHTLLPAAFISEGIDQTRGWFYTLTILSVALFEQEAFKNVIVSGIVMAEDGKKMSKRLKNYTPPDTLMDTYGADALRLYLLQSNLVRAEEMRFSDAGVKDITRRIQIPWWNALKFLDTYASIDRWRFKLDALAPSENILDRWIISRLSSFLHHMNHDLSKYQLHTIVGHTQTFLEDLTNTYIRLNRARFWQSGLEQDKQACYATLFHVLSNFTSAMAPLAPFLSESIHQKLKAYQPDGELSVHMTRYPSPEPEQSNHALEMAVSRMQEVLLLGRQQRNDAKIKIKTPLPSLEIIHAHPHALDDLMPLSTYLKEELNVKQVFFSHDEAAYVDLSCLLNTAKLGPKLGKATGILSKAARALDHSTILAFEESGKITLEGHELKEDDLIIRRTAKPESGAVSTKSITMRLDLQLTPELISEGHAREVISFLQNARKESGFSVADRITISWICNQALHTLLMHFQTHIQSEVLCTRWTLATREKLSASEHQVTSPWHFHLEHLEGYAILEVHP